MIYNQARRALHRTGKFLSRGYNTLSKYASMFDQGMTLAHHVAKAVAPIVDREAGTRLSGHTQKGMEDYQMVRSRVLGLHNEGASIGNQLVGSLRRDLPHLGL